MTWIQIGEVYNAIPAAACADCGSVVVRHELPAECGFCGLLARLDALGESQPGPTPDAEPPASLEPPRQPLGLAEFGAEVRKARKELGMNQAELCKEIGVSTGVLSRIENGHAAASRSVRAFLCEFLGIDDGSDAETVIAARGR